MERPGSNNGSCPGCRLERGPAAGAATGLAAVLIFTIVVDVLGNALVILSVLRNKKLRNAGERQAGAGRARGAGGAERSGPALHRTSHRAPAPHGPAAARAAARGGRPERTCSPGLGRASPPGSPGRCHVPPGLRDAGERCPLLSARPAAAAAVLRLFQTFIPQRQPQTEEPAQVKPTSLQRWEERGRGAGEDDSECRDRG